MIYIYIYIYYIFIYKYIYIYIYIYLYTYIYIHVIYIYIYIYICIYIHTCIYIYRLHIQFFAYSFCCVHDFLYKKHIDGLQLGYFSMFKLCKGQMFLNMYKENLYLALVFWNISIYYHSTCQNEATALHKHFFYYFFRG